MEERVCEMEFEWLDEATLSDLPPDEADRRMDYYTSSVVKQLVQVDLYIHSSSSSSSSFFFITCIQQLYFLYIFPFL